MHGLEDDDNAGRFGFMRQQFGEISIAPIRKIHNFAGLSFQFRCFGGFQNVKSTAVEKERVIPKQAVQLRNHRMIVGKGLSIELG